MPTLDLMDQQVTAKVSLSQGWADADFDEIHAVFTNSFPGQASWVGNYVLASSNEKISLKATVDGKIVGVYGLNVDRVDKFINYIRRGTFDDLYRYRGEPGMHGIALAVLPEYRGQGIGRKLILNCYCIARACGCKYSFGIQLRELNNLNQWKKRRRLIGSSAIQHLTLVDL